MDINLPGISGLEATRRIVDSRPDVRVVLLSTYAKEDLPADAMSCGAIAYIRKEDLTPRAAARGVGGLTTAHACRGSAGITARDASAAARARLDGQHAAERAEPVLHVQEAVAERGRLGVESLAVVGHGEHEIAVLRRDLDRDRGAGTGVLRRVLHRLETAEVRRGLDRFGIARRRDGRRRCTPAVDRVAAVCSASRSPRSRNSGG